MTNVVQLIPRPEREETNLEAVERIDATLEMILQGNRPKPAEIIRFTRAPRL